MATSGAVVRFCFIFHTVFCFCNIGVLMLVIPQIPHNSDDCFFLYSVDIFPPCQRIQIYCDFPMMLCGEVQYKSKINALIFFFLLFLRPLVDYHLCSGNETRSSQIIILRKPLHSNAKDACFSRI